MFSIAVNAQNAGFAENVEYFIILEETSFPFQDAT